ncbi:MAG: ABC transporter permease [Armatimonadota bacterium]|nr:ABC transporter permease [Armatimonadota bacterium]
MREYIQRRLAETAVVLLGVTVVTFLMLHLVPGDPATVLATWAASPQMIDDLRRKWGLNDPLAVQYLRYLGGLLRGDLGESFITGQRVAEAIRERLPPSLLLAVAATAVGTGAGIVLGVASAVRRNALVDRLATLASLTLLSLPNFWLGLLLIIVFSLSLGWLPVQGYGTFRHLILPAVVLSALPLALIARITRSAMLDVLSADYVRTSRAKGLSERVVIYRHALKNALIPVATLVGLQLGFLVGGAVVVEAVFAWPGIGRFLVQSIQNRDFPNIRGVILTFAVLFTALNLTVDVLYAALDPRIHYR